MVFSFVSDAWSGSGVPVQYPGGNHEGSKYAILIQTILARSMETVLSHLRPHGLGQVRHARDRQRVFRHRRRGQSDQDLGPRQQQTKAQCCSLSSFLSAWELQELQDRQELCLLLYYLVFSILP